MVFGMDSALYVKLSALMFMEFAILGAWRPVLAARLQGPLGLNRRQTAWVYAALSIACVIMPLVAGQLGDRRFNAELVLAAGHLGGALLLFVVAWKKSFGSLFTFMLLYSLCYAATLPLVNALMFYHLAEAQVSLANSAYIFAWVPIGWASGGYGLAAWRRRFAGQEQGRDCLVLAAVLSVILAVVCGSGLMPNMPPTDSDEAAMTAVLGRLGDPSFLAFILISVAVAAMMTFYLIVRDRFLADRDAAGRVPVDQIAAVLAALFVLNWAARSDGGRVALALGATLLFVLFQICAHWRNKHVLVISQGLYGLAYICFIVGGQIYGAAAAPEGAIASTQGLVFAAQGGVGVLLGMLLTGLVMQKYDTRGYVPWRRLWIMLAAIVFVCTLVAYRL